MLKLYIMLVFAHGIVQILSLKLGEMKRTPKLGSSSSQVAISLGFPTRKVRFFDVFANTQ